MRVSAAADEHAQQQAGSGGNGHGFPGVLVHEMVGGVGSGLGTLHRAVLHRLELFFGFAKPGTDAFAHGLGFFADLIGGHTQLDLGIFDDQIQVVHQFGFLFGVKCNHGILLE